MGGTPRTSRVYIVSQTSLFAQGIRSLLQEQPMIEIIGVEGDPIRAMEAVRSLHPDVVIVESSQEENKQLTLDIMLQNNAPGRVVAFDLKHNNAIVYNRHRVHSMRKEDLVKAIRGARKQKQQVPAPDPQQGKAAKRTRPAANPRFITS